MHLWGHRMHSKPKLRVGRCRSWRKTGVAFTKAHWRSKTKSDFRSVFELAKSGDKVSREIRDYCLEVWATAAVGLIHAYDPELIVIGGGVMRSGDVILPFIQQLRIGMRGRRGAK